jgi:GntR family transcriptional regulator
MSSTDHKGLNPHSPVPLHYQLQEIIRQEALNGNLADENGKVPTEFELIDRYKVSRITVRNALNRLVEQGLLRRERGRGTFLRSNEVENWVGSLFGFSEMITASGMKPGAKMLYKRFVHDLPERVATQLKVQSAWEYKRIRLADDNPIAIELSYFPVDIGHVFDQIDIDSTLIYRFIESNLGIALNNGRQVISAVNAVQEDAEILNVSVGEALLYMERVIYSIDQRPIEYLEAVYVPQYFQYVVQLRR